ncbi:hypothetical protein AB8O64_28770 [Streptomyces sp. QH1-20]|uniref:hypothetical protein n=1 Tax=Streptomyces sp. QH1-20 TaxID=3240934 RepID=UPI0035142D06
MKRIAVAACLAGGIVALTVSPAVADPNPGIPSLTRTVTKTLKLPAVFSNPLTSTFEGLDMDDIINKVEQAAQGR